MNIIFAIAVLFIGVICSNASVVNVPENKPYADDDFIGTTVVDLDGETCKKNECNLGNFIADVLRREFLIEQQEASTQLDGTVVLLLANRASTLIEKGTNITEKHVNTILPKPDSIVAANMTGESLKAALEYSVRNYNQKHGSNEFLQLSGAHVEFDFAQNKSKWLVSSKVICKDCSEYKDINNKGLYYVIMNEEMFKGASGYNMIEKENSLKLNNTDRQMTSNRIKQLEKIYPAVEGRIVLHNVDKAPSSGIVSSVSSVLLMTVLVMQSYLS